MNKGRAIKRCEDLIRSYNPVTHSIDTHCSHHLGTCEDAKPENVFIQQVAYGWYRERSVLEIFIKNFYADNAARLLRTDIMMYTIFAYLALFRLEEMGFRTFKEFALTQDPMKIYNFAAYLFNKENLWNCLRAGWMKVRDLQYVEEELIAGIEQFLPDLSKLCQDLEEKAVGLAAAAAAKEEAKKTGSIGLGEIRKRGVTRPISPHITKPKPREVLLPESISTRIEATEVPELIYRTSLEEIAKKRQQERDAQRLKTKSKYSEKFHFQLSETKYGRTMDELRKEVEDERIKDVAFDSSFTNEPPDVSKISAKVRINASTVLREDYLYRKQQAKDAQILKAYEEELRDPSEFYAWQREMKERDDLLKLQHVENRRIQSKLSADEAREAILKQKEDNKTVADILREQSEAIVQQRVLENDIITQERYENAAVASELREQRLKEAKEKVLQEKAEKSRKLRQELEAARRTKEKQDQVEEEQRADTIRQLRALDLVQKKPVTVFDPTQAAGVGVLDEMSYMEMKERLEYERKRAEEAEERRRFEILQSKHKRAEDLDIRTQTINRARQVKVEVNKSRIQARKDAEKRDVELKEQVRAAAAVGLNQELQQKREKSRAVADALKAEEQRIKRQQQYMGAAAGLVEEMRAEQMMMGLERETRLSQNQSKEEAIGMEQSLTSDRANRALVKKRAQIERSVEMKLKEHLSIAEKVTSVAKVKENILLKKAMVKEGREQHEKTRHVIEEHNPYAASISAEIHEKTLLAKSKQRNAYAALV